MEERVAARWRFVAEKVQSMVIGHVLCGGEGEMSLKKWARPFFFCAIASPVDGASLKYEWDFFLG